MKIFWTYAVILIEKTYNGILSQQFIIGIFNFTVFCDTPFFTLHPLRDRLLNTRGRNHPLNGWRLKR